MTRHNRPCMALRITVLTAKGLVCHSEYQYSQLKSPVCHSGNQYSPLRALHVTQGISNHHYRSCMSLRAPVLTTTCLVCHTSIRPVCHSTSTNLYQPGMSVREQVLRSSTLVCHGRRTVLKLGEGVQSKKISNVQELIQSDLISCPQNQKGSN